MRLGPVEEHFTAVSALRESRHFSIKDSTNALHVFICSNDLKSMDIASILISSCVCCAAVLHSKRWHNIHKGNVICFPPSSIDMKYNMVYMNVQGHITMNVIAKVPNELNQTNHQNNQR